MSSQDIVLLSVVSGMQILLVCVGIIIGKHLKTQNAEIIAKPQSFFDKQKIENQQHKISIDDKKVVLNIDTAGLEKKHQTIGQVTQTKENISSSVDKLKNLKR